MDDLIFRTLLAVYV